MTSCRAPKGVFRGEDDAPHKPHLCPYAQRAAIVAAEKGIRLPREYIRLDAKPGWFLALSPTGKVPLLQVDRDVLFESAAICEYLDELSPDRLHPDDPLERAQHGGWMEFASAILNDIAGLYSAPDQEGFEAKRRSLRTRFEQLEHVVSGRYFAGDRFHMVDAFYGSVFRYFDVVERHVGFGLFSDLPKVAAWRRAVAKRPSVKDAVSSTYAEQLEAFLIAKSAHLSALVLRSQSAGAKAGSADVSLLSA